jgi:16S rRNA (uracil1498-N3)-methyltransferase
MHRFYIPPHAWRPDQLALDPAEAHHAVDVLRLLPSDRITLFSGEGEEVTAEIVRIDKKQLELRALSRAKTPPLGCHITLAQAIPKGKNMDFIVEKATELGATVIQPLLSERTVVQYGPEEAGKKGMKWQRVAIEAAKQCGQNWLPTVPMPATTKSFLAAAPKFDLMLIASLQPGARHLKEVLRESSSTPPKRVLVLVGPEGDFTPAEVNLAMSSGCQPITLGPIILRTETAAIYCLSVLSHELLNPQS